jgi:MFS family permease
MGVLVAMHVFAGIFEVPTGVFSDRIGRRATMIVYHAAFTIGAAASFLGFGTAMRSGAISAYVYENLESLGKAGEYKKFEGERQALGRWGLVASGILGTGIIYFYDMQTAVLVTIVSYLAAVVLSFWLVEVRALERGKSNVYGDIHDAWRLFTADMSLRNISIGRIIAQGAGNVEYRFRALLFATIMPEWLINFLGMLNNVLTGIAMKYAHTLVHRFGFIGNLVYAEIFVRIATVALTLVQTVWSFALMNIVTSVVFGVREVAAEDLLQERYRPEKRATMGSMVGLGSSIVYAVLGVLIGYLADTIGLVYTVLCMQVFMGTAAWFFYRGITTRVSPVHE